MCVCVCRGGGWVGGAQTSFNGSKLSPSASAVVQNFGLHEGFLTLKAPITTVADDIHKYCFIGRGFTWKIKPYFLRKIKIKK